MYMIWSEDYEMWEGGTSWTRQREGLGTLRQFGRSTHTRNKRDVTIPIVWVKPVKMSGDHHRRSTDQSLCPFDSQIPPYTQNLAHFVCAVTGSSTETFEEEPLMWAPVKVADVVRVFTWKRLVVFVFTPCPWRDFGWTGPTLFSSNPRGWMLSTRRAFELFIYNRIKKVRVEDKKCLD
jgi:hypothetical protein